MQTSEYESPEIVTNGTAKAMQAGPRARRREDWFDFPEGAQETYPEFRVKLWTNFRRALLEDITSGDNDRAFGALRQIVLEHNGWCDEDGQPYPPANDPTFWDAIPTELAAVIIVCIQQAARRLPNSLLRTNT